MFNCMPWKTWLCIDLQQRIKIRIVRQSRFKVAEFSLNQHISPHPPKKIIREMEEGSDSNPPNRKSLNCEAFAFPLRIIVITGQTPVGVASCMSPVVVCGSCPQSQQNVGTKAVISESPDKTRMKLQTPVGWNSRVY